MYGEGCLAMPSLVSIPEYLTHWTFTFEKKKPNEIKRSWFQIKLVEPSKRPQLIPSPSEKLERQTSNRKQSKRISEYAKCYHP